MTVAGSPEAVAVARELYGLDDVTATPLPGERDRNVRLRAADGRAYVLKLHHPDADPAELDLQDAALRHLADRGIPAPRLVRTAAGALQARWPSPEGERTVRLLTWIEGTPWRDAGPADAARMAALGRTVAALDSALADFAHPAMRRPLRWNLTAAPDAARWAPLVDPALRPAVSAVLDRFAADVAPRLTGLPHQVVHNDANEHNVLVGADGGIAGLIDFGDVVWSPRVCGLAIAAAYAMQGQADPARAVAPLVAGYDQVAPLQPAELELLFDLARTRLAQSACLAARQHADDPSNPYLLVSQAGVADLLRRLAHADPEPVLLRFRDACGYEAAPGARAVRQWFASGRAVAAPVLPGDGTARAPLAGTVDAVAGNTLLLAHATAEGVPFWTRITGVRPALAAGTAVTAGESVGAVAGRTAVELRASRAALGPGDEDLRAGVVFAAHWLAPAPPAPGTSGGDAPPDAAVPPRPVLDAATIARRRAGVLSPALSLAYDEPLHLVRGRGAHLYDPAGRAYLDLVNNVCHVGHCHPRVVAAGQRQMAVLNTNTRYLHEAVVTYARRLAATLPDPLRVVFLVNSGSEANDLALRLARTHTRRRDVLVLEHAYHGHLSSLVDLSPYKFDRPGGTGRPPHTHVCALPDRYRGRLRDAQATGAAYARDVQARLDALPDGPAVFFAESLAGVGGQIAYPDGYLAAAFGAVRAAGGVCVADEVQVGFGRVGRHFWGFELQGVVPDVVTLGKPMGNGHPLAAVVTTPLIARSFQTGMEYFNTFGGNPVSAEIGLAVLDVVEEERLQAHATRIGAHLVAGLHALQRRHPLIGDVRGAGLFLGVELTADPATRAPHTDAAQTVKEAMKARGILLSTDGPDDNVLKLKPPLVLSQDDADHVLEALDAVLARW